MLDNLKLGYGGTKTEMERLLADATKITGVKYDISSLNDVFQAIHVIQDEIGITGTTAKEAEETITGSVNTMKASWDNFLNGSGTFDQFVESAKIAFNNIAKAATELLPRIMQDVIDALPTQLVKTLKVLIPILVTLGTALGVIWGYLKAVAIIKAVSKAFATLNGIMVANPIVLIVAAIAGLVAGFLYLWKTNENFRKFWIKLWDNIKKAVTNVVKNIVTFFTKTIPNAIKRIVDNISQATQRIKNFFTNAWNSIRNVWLAVANWFKMTVVEPIKKVFNPLVDWFKKLFKSIWDFISSVFSVIGSLAKGCVDVIKAVWGIVANWFNNTVVKPISQFFSNAWNSIKNGALNAWNSIKNGALNVWNGIKNGASSALNGIKGVWGSVSSWFNNTIINPISNAFNNIWNKVKNGASNAWSGIRNIFSNVPSWFRNQFTSAWTNVKNVFSTGGKIFTGIKEGIGKLFKQVVQKIIDGINKVIKKPFETINDALNKIRNVTIIKLQPFKNLPRISIPQIPSIMEQGGVLKKGEVGLLEGNGAEAVVPLHQNRKWIRAVADDMRRAVLTENGAINANSIVRSNNGYNNIINAKFDIDGSVEIDGKRAGRIIAPYTMQTIKVGGGYR